MKVVISEKECIWPLQMSCKVMKEGKIVGICLNEVDFSDATKRIPSFAEAIKGKESYMKQILEFLKYYTR